MYTSLLLLHVPPLAPFFSVPLSLSFLSTSSISHSFLLLVPSFAPSLACLLLSSPPSFLPLSPFSLPHFFPPLISPPTHLPPPPPPQLAEMRAEYQRENEDILDNIRQIAKEVQLQALVMDHFIPLEYQVTKQHTLSHIECCTNEVLQILLHSSCVPLPPSPPTSCGLDRQCCMITQNGRRTLGSGMW